MQSALAVAQVTQTCNRESFNHASFHTAPEHTLVIKAHVPHQNVVERKDANDVSCAFHDSINIRGKAPTNLSCNVHMQLSCHKQGTEYHLIRLTNFCLPGITYLGQVQPAAVLQATTS
jgi:hypothetical protein